MEREAYKAFLLKHNYWREEDGEYRFNRLFSDHQSTKHYFSFKLGKEITKEDGPLILGRLLSDMKYYWSLEVIDSYFDHVTQKFSIDFFFIDHGSMTLQGRPEFFKDFVGNKIASHLYHSGIKPTQLLPQVLFAIQYYKIHESLLTDILSPFVSHSTNPNDERTLRNYKIVQRGSWQSNLFFERLSNYRSELLKKRLVYFGQLSEALPRSLDALQVQDPVSSILFVNIKDRGILEDMVQNILVNHKDLLLKLLDRLLQWKYKQFLLTELLPDIHQLIYPLFLLLHV